MRFSQRGINLLCALEGFSAVPYPDSGGALTIGFGHLILPGQRWDEPLTRAEGVWILLGDAAYAEHCLDKSLTVELTQNQYDALICFTFNVGAGAFRKSTLLRLLNAGPVAMAAHQFDVWIYDNGVKVPGLQKRRAREKQLFLTVEAFDDT